MRKLKAVMRQIDRYRGCTEFYGHDHFHIAVHSEELLVTVEKCVAHVARVTGHLPADLLNATEFITLVYLSQPSYYSVGVYKDNLVLVSYDNAGNMCVALQHGANQEGFDKLSAELMNFKWEN